MLGAARRQAARQLLGWSQGTNPTIAPLSSRWIDSSCQPLSSPLHSAENGVLGHLQIMQAGYQGAAHRLMQTRGMARATPHIVQVRVRQDCEVGQEGDVVKVAAGFARNYLVPKKLVAYEVSPRQILRASDRKALEKAEAARLEEAVEVQTTEVVQATAEADPETDAAATVEDAMYRLLSSVVNMRSSTGRKTNSLSQPLTSTDVLAAVRRQMQVVLHPENLSMEKGIDTLGEHAVPLVVPGYPSALTLKVVVRRG